MSVFAVLSGSTDPTLEKNITKVYSDENYYAYSDMTWFVSDGNVTAAQVCQKLGIGENQSIDAVVIRVPGSYFGFTSNALWEWLKLKSASA